MKMTINLLADDRREDNKREEAMMFVATLGGVTTGGVIALTYIITEKLVGIVL